MWASKMYILHSMGPLNHQNRTFGGKLIFDIQLKYGRGNFSKIQLFFFFLVYIRQNAYLTKVERRNSKKKFKIYGHFRFAKLRPNMHNWP